MRGVLAKCRSTTFSASGLHSTTKFCQKSTSTKFVNKVNQILVTSTIYNIKSEKSTILTKVGIFSSTNLHIFWSYICNLQVFQSKKYHLQSTSFWPLLSTICNKNKGQIYNLQIDLTPLPPAHIKKFQARKPWTVRVNFQLVKNRKFLPIQPYMYRPVRVQPTTETNKQNKWRQTNTLSF